MPCVTIQIIIFFVIEFRFSKRGKQRSSKRGGRSGEHGGHHGHRELREPEGKAVNASSEESEATESALLVLEPAPPPTVNAWFKKGGIMSL